MSISFTVTKSGGGTAVLGTDYLYDGIETLIFLTSCSFTSSTNLIISNLVAVGGGGNALILLSQNTGGGGGGGGQVTQITSKISLINKITYTVTIGSGGGGTTTFSYSNGNYTAFGGYNATTANAQKGGASYGNSGTYTKSVGEDGSVVTFTYSGVSITTNFGGGGGAGHANDLYGYNGGAGGGGGGGGGNVGGVGGSGVNGGGGGSADRNGNKFSGSGGNGISFTTPTIGQTVLGEQVTTVNTGQGGNGGNGISTGGIGGTTTGGTSAATTGGQGAPNTGGGGGAGYNPNTGGSGIVILSFTLPYPCFLKSSKILTNYGYIPIEDLKKGDLVKTLLHDFKPIAMIGKKEIYHPACKERLKNQLYQCSRDNYPELLEPLVLTGCHSILVENSTSVVDAEQIEKVIAVNGGIYLTDGKLRLPACVDEKTTVFPNEGTYTIYHIALENDDYYMNYGIYANGLLVETTSNRYLKELSNMTLL
jgi:hypothetical protein